LFLPTGVILSLQSIKFETIFGGNGAKWDRVVPENINVICTTPQSLLNAIYKRNISMSQIDLLIIDEYNTV